MQVFWISVRFTTPCLLRVNGSKYPVIGCAKYPPGTYVPGVPGFVWVIWRWARQMN
ncbi:hypothetical protein AB0K00_29330 [Dactylosporangium sp. NPDC049525]|uniref:hypothetical protein n=1 Tax=Dactylosporangium sp. NPDC049525 TaxID=3154730 RepID=UPI00341B42BA